VEPAPEPKSDENGDFWSNGNGTHDVPAPIDVQHVDAPRRRWRIFGRAR